MLLNYVRHLINISQTLGNVFKLGEKKVMRILSQRCEHYKA